jgi:tellurite methyltransferase
LSPLVSGTPYARVVERRIVGFERDDADDWVALLDCLHRRHVRHRPPLWPAPWVDDDVARQQQIGAPVACPLCDRTEVPADMEVVRTTVTWDEHSMPNALRRPHRVASGTWGRLRVDEGRLRFVAQTTPVTDVLVEVGRTQGIPPDVEHFVETDGPVRFAVDFLTRQQ